MNIKKIFIWGLAVCLTGITLINFYGRNDKKTVDIEIQPTIQSTIQPTITFQPTITITMTPTPFICPAKPLPTQKPVKYLALPRGSTGAFKAWEGYDSITNQRSRQYKLKQLYRLDENGCYRFNNDYAVAMGTFYVKNIGQRFEITFSTGKTIKVIAGDVKANKDTINGQYCKANGSIIEFIVDSSMLPKGMGDVSNLGFKGSIKSIREIS